MRYSETYRSHRREHGKAIINCALAQYGSYWAVARAAKLSDGVTLKRIANGESTPQVRTYRKLKRLEKIMLRIGR